MRCLLLVFMIMNIASSYSNNMGSADAIINSLTQSGVKNIVSMSDNAKRGFIVWSNSENQIKGIEFYCTENDEIISHTIRIKKLEKSFFKDIVSNFNNINDLDSIHCDDKVHSFLKISVECVIEGKRTPMHNFYTHCKLIGQEDKYKPIIGLYFAVF